MDGQGQWLGFPEAAKVLGVSIRSVRRYVQEGRYATRWTEGARQLRLSEDSQPLAKQGRDGRTRNGSPFAASHPGLDRPSEDGQLPQGIVADTAAVVALVALLHEEREERSKAEHEAREMASAAAMWQERARNLEAELTRVLALPPHEEPRSATRLPARPESSRASWWRRLFGRAVEPSHIL